MADHPWNNFSDYLCNDLCEVRNVVKFMQGAHVVTKCPYLKHQNNQIALLWDREPIRTLIRRGQERVLRVIWAPKGRVRKIGVLRTDAKPPLPRWCNQCLALVAEAFPLLLPDIDFAWARENPSFKTLCKASLRCIEARTPTQNPKTPKKHCIYTNFFDKFARASACVTVMWVRNQPEAVQKNVRRWKFWFWVDLGGWILWGGFSSSECRVSR